VAAGTATFTASQAQSAQYNAPTPVTSNTLTVSKVTPTLVFVNPPASKSLTDAAFTVTATSGILFSVSNSGSGAYVINGSSNPTLTVIRGMRYILSVNASGHPFWIQTVSGAYSGGNIYSNSSIVNNGEDVGNIIWEVAFDTPTTLYYACQYHSSMQGVINVV
jgi:plastocyanin